ncbi:MAG: hypothetical protein K9M02_11265 [Thiohalocapsa sp.]|nr:hypothetical protein [Thiohalocapsa sp.]
MKFPKLPIGQRFRWRGTSYRKDGPMTATSESDAATRMIPRSADVEIIDAAASEAKGSAEAALTRDSVDAALAAMVEHLRLAADRLQAADAAAMRRAVDEARALFEASIEQS